jgi:hypothetical protein
MTHLVEKIAFSSNSAAWDCASFVQSEKRFRFMLRHPIAAQQTRFLYTLFSEELSEIFTFTLLEPLEWIITHGAEIFEAQMERKRGALP